MTAIVCLDGYALNPGDIDWAPFEALGELTVHDRTPKEDVVAKVAQATCVLTNKTPLSRTTLQSLPELKYIGVLATGFNVVDVDCARERDVVVTNVPTYGTDSVAQHVTALMLQLARPIELHDRSVHAGEWSRSQDWCYALSPISSLAGQTLGIVGVGRIGLAVARIAAAMDMRIVGVDVQWPPVERLQGIEIENVGIDELFRAADVVSLHCPLTPANHHLVDERKLALMKPTAAIINTSRGPLIDERALADALTRGQLGAAALDVLECEPPAANHPLLNTPNCVITPHIAWYARTSRQRLMDVAAANLAAFQAGNPVNRVT